MTRPRLALLTALALGGCSSLGDSEYGQYYQLVRQGMRNSFGQSSVTLKEAAAIPYASMGWRLNGERENLIVLATDTNGDQLWTSAAHVVLQTQYGRIRRTVGLPHDLAALSPLNGPSLPPPALALAGPYSDKRQADFPDMGVYGAVLSCRGRVIGKQTIRILGKAIQTTRVDETCSNAALGWTFTNSFWVDAESGFVWRSDQSIHPGDARIQTEIFRPPG